MFQQNRRRLYIAFFTRERKYEGDVKYHTALILSEKSPKVQKEEESTLLLHVRDRILEDGKVHWFYEPKKSRPRTARMAGVVLLAKIPNNIEERTIVEVLRDIPLSEDASDRSWRCRHWVWSAIDVLIDHKIIPSLPAGMTPERMWNNIYRLLDAADLSQRDYLKEPLLTFDVSGKAIPSELGPLY